MIRFCAINVGEVTMLTVRTRPTLESYRKYWWSRPRAYVNLAMAGGLVVFELLQLVLTVLNYIINREGAVYILISLLFIAAGIFFILWVCYMPRKLFNMSQKLCNDVNETLTFGEESFIAENIGSKINEKVTNMYTSVTKVKHSNGWFIIMCDRYRFYAFRENEITEGSPAGLRALLSAKTGKI